MKAELHLLQGLSFVGRSETNHWVPVDTTTDVGGAQAATKPIELILLALAGCSSMDVVSILRKKRVPFTSYDVEVDADRADEHPRVFTRIHLIYRVVGEGVKEQDVAAAVRLSHDKYCAVSAMLGRACPITYEVRVGP